MHISTPTLRALTYSGHVPQEGGLLRFESTTKNGCLVFALVYEFAGGQAVDLPYTCRAETYVGFIPQLGDILRLARFKGGYLELVLRVDDFAAGPNKAVPKAEDTTMEPSDLSDMDSKPVGVRDGTSVASAIELVDTDDEESAKGEQDKPQDDDADDEDIPLSQVFPMKTTTGTVAPSKITQPISTSSSLASRRQYRCPCGRLRQPHGRRSTKDERHDMAVYIVKKGRSFKGDYFIAWAEFRKQKDYKSRSTKSWVRIYLNNREEIEGKANELRAELGLP
ncbi:unnamed protein product [Peniophora sp. CBMAI 1063]|nr:unnamed protein product [Peniophora sp. CBMAI 1063]